MKILNNIQSRDKSKNLYTIVLIPGDKSDKTRSFMIGKFGMIAVSFIIFLIIFSISIIILIYTPVGLMFPLTNIEVENKYNKQILQVQEKLNSLINEIVTLRQYNLHLRKALGEKINDNDSSMQDFKRTKLLVENLKKQTDPSIEVESSLSESESQIGKKIEFIKTNSITAHSDFQLIIPFEGIITKEFNLDEGHLGIDIVGKLGSLIYAPAPGTVIFSNWTYNYGYTLIIAHKAGYRTVYKHNQSLLKTEGEVVKRGDPIAILGNTGSESSGPHLHFEVWKDDIPLNPKKFLLNINN